MAAAASNATAEKLSIKKNGVCNYGQWYVNEAGKYIQVIPQDLGIAVQLLEGIIGADDKYKKDNFNGSDNDIIIQTMFTKLHSTNGHALYEIFNSKRQTDSNYVEVYNCIINELNKYNKPNSNTAGGARRKHTRRHKKSRKHTRRQRQRQRQRA